MVLVVSTDKWCISEILKNAKLSGFNNAELIAGDVLETIPRYKKENPGFRICLLHLDLDTYKGTKVVLENFYDLVTPGGIILLDEYGKRGWGESFFTLTNMKVSELRRTEDRDLDKPIIEVPST